MADVDLVLASTSRYRRELLARLGRPFRMLAADVDETARPGETASALAARLAQAKALAVATRCPDALIVGSDQVAECDGRLLGKPGTAEAACAQLAACSGRSVAFHTALCLVDTRGAAVRTWAAIDATRVVFRDLAPDEIARYVAIEQPLDCAGSFKAESLGITLFERIENDDPSALIGLPLIALARLLRAAGITLP
jgi:septum formation protein